MPDPASPTPSDNVPAAPDANEIQALLDQAEALASDAAVQVGAEPASRLETSPDIERPPIGTTHLDDQMDEVAALVEQAGRETGTLEPSAVIPLPAPESRLRADGATPSVDESKAGDGDAMLSEIIDQATDASPSAVAVETAVQQAVSQPDETLAAVETPSPATSEPVESQNAVEPALPGADTSVARAHARTSLVALPLAWLNRPFARVRDDTRSVVGWIAIVTIMTAVALWMLPAWMRPAAH